MTKNMINPLISVIVPVYNVEKYLPECIESIISQYYENLEILLVDDGSTDRFGAICDTYAKKDKRVRVIHQKNGGLSAARNKGLDNCSGEYITFVDSDDYIEKELLQILYSNILETDSDCVVSAFSETTDEKNIISRHGVIGKTVMSGRDSLLSHYTDFRNETNLATVWGKLYHADLFFGIRFTEQLHFEDIMLMPYWCLKCKKITFIPFFGYYYRRNQNSITMNQNPEHLKKLYIDSFFIFNNHIELYKKLGYPKLRNCIENQIADKIITHSINDSIPKGLEKWTKNEFNRHCKEIISSGISFKRKIKIAVFQTIGIRGSRLLHRLLK